MDFEELRKNASPALIAANPDVFGVLPQQGANPASVAPSCPIPVTCWKDFEGDVIKWLRDNGWKCVHSRPARVLRKGVETWETPFSGRDSKGFPDILAIKKYCIVLEVKSGSGKASTEQVGWMLAFERAGIRAFLVTPENWEQTIIKIEEL